MKKELSGWGLTAPGLTDVINDNELQPLSNYSNQKLIPRGCGRSYGDASYVSGGTTVNMTAGVTQLDSGKLIVRTVSGTTIEQLISEFVPKGLFVPVTPGTKFVTVGGAIAADVHGKNHHMHGSIGSHIEAMVVQTPIGTFETDGDENTSLHWATIGGMGLTGIIERADIKMVGIETSSMKVSSFRLSNIQDLMKSMKDLDSTSTYTVAWIDAMASGRNFGRGVVTVGEHATIQELPTSEQDYPLKYSQSTGLTAPNFFPTNTINKLSAKAFNEVWFRKTPIQPKVSLQPISKFFHPLDEILLWNRVYGKSGFLQYQFAIPDASSYFISKVLASFAELECPIFLSVLKRFGPSNPSFMSFPFEGWTLALDFPTKFPNIEKLLWALDEELVAIGGRIYLAKDSRMHPKHLPLMYPRLEEFRAIKGKFDPNRIIQSNLSRRLMI